MIIEMFIRGKRIFTIQNPLLNKISKPRNIGIVIVVQKSKPEIIQKAGSFIKFNFGLSVNNL